MATTDKVRYESDVIAWANEQACLLRAGRFAELDIEHIADEIEDVGKAERREFEKRMAGLLCQLLKWQHQPERHQSNLQGLIKLQRKIVARCLAETPSLKNDLQDAEWWRGVWGDALVKAFDETEIDLSLLPETCPWSEKQVFSAEFFPL